MLFYKLKDLFKKFEINEVFSKHHMYDGQRKVVTMKLPPSESWDDERMLNCVGEQLQIAPIGSLYSDLTLMFCPDEKNEKDVVKVSFYIGMCFLTHA